MFSLLQLTNVCKLYEQQLLGMRNEPNRARPCSLFKESYEECWRGTFHIHLKDLFSKSLIFIFGEKKIYCACSGK